MGLKINNTNSQFSSQKEEKEKFENQIERSQQQVSQESEEARELGMKMIKILGDKTLKENKGQIARNLEQSVISSLQELATRINNKSESSEGSVMLFTIAISGCMRMRDRMNELEYKISQVQKMNEPEETNLK